MTTLVLSGLLLGVLLIVLLLRGEDAPSPPERAQATPRDWAVAHECGHAMLAFLSEKHIVRFIQTGNGSGGTLLGEREPATTAYALFNRIKIHMGGLAGEQAAFKAFLGYGAWGDLSTGMIDAMALLRCLDRNELSNLAMVLEDLPPEIALQLDQLIPGGSDLPLLPGILAMAYNAARRDIEAHPESFRALRIASKQDPILLGPAAERAFRRGFRKDTRRKKKNPGS